MPCLSESISDLVKRAEADEIAGLVGSEGGGADAEDVLDFMAVAGFEFADEGLSWMELLKTPRVYEDEDPCDEATLNLDVTGEFRKGSSHGGHVINEDVEPSGGNESLELRTGGEAFHRVGTGMEDLADLDDIGINFSCRNQCASAARTWGMALSPVASRACGATKQAPGGS